MATPKHGSIHVRPARPEDLPTVVDFNAAMAWETEGRTLDRTILHSGVSAVLSDESLGFYLVAECDGEIAGQLLITYEWSDWRNALFWWIQSVFVAPKFRLRGVYMTLHEEVARQARANGVCGLRLYVDQDNVAAQGVYARLGMAQARYHMYELEFGPDE